MKIFLNVYFIIIINILFKYFLIKISNFHSKWIKKLTGVTYLTIFFQTNYLHDSYI